MLKFGYIVDIDFTTGKARVQFPDADGMVSNWLPMSVPKTKTDKFSIGFDINEHVWCLMDENLEFGVIGGAIYSTADTPGDIGDADIIGVQFAQGLTIEYTRSTRILTINGGHQLIVDIDNNIKLKSATKVQVEAPLIEVTGNMTVTGSVSAGSFGAVTSGGGTGDMAVAGKITAAGDIESTGGDIKQGAIKLGTHKHLGVTTGGGTSGTPTP